ncbi:MAG: Fic/DOC family protein [Methanomassiliicoccales archaeon PtaU1.Bin124]|nr:MAG: Fic/DOC family protein [Methanomassiliicoccales archaeon PtaU1.Bin124]
MTNGYDKLERFVPKYTPVRHKRKVPFGPEIMVSPDLNNRILRIRELDFELDRFVLMEKDYAELVLDAYSTNIHWSTKIEGNPLTQDEVRRVTRKTLVDGNVETQAGPIQEIVNHLLLFLNKEIVNQKWDKEFICFMHELLLQNTKTNVNIGEYKKTENDIQEKGETVFRTCPSQHVEEEMGSLLNWIMEKGPAYDPIVAASVFFHEFESIHPFEDGNGRLGRTLFHLYLINHGLKKSNLCKIDFELLKNAPLYYNILAYTDETGDYLPLTEMFSIAVLNSYEVAISSLSGKNLLSSSLDESSKRIIQMAKKIGTWFSIKEAVTWVDTLGEQPVRDRLKHLVELGVLESRGKTKGLRFRFKIPFTNTRELMQSLIDDEDEENAGDH